MVLTISMDVASGGVIALYLALQRVAIVCLLHGVLSGPGIFAPSCVELPGCVGPSLPGLYIAGHGL